MTSRRPRTNATIVFLLTLAIAAPVLSGCTPVGLALGAGATAATASQKEKGFKTSLADTGIQTEVNHYLLQSNFDLFSAVSVSVEEGRVLLTGAVDNADTRIQATRLAWKASGVAEVINEIQVRDETSLLDRARDTVIATELRGRLLLDQDIDSINYSVDAVNGVVYLFGIAKNSSELDRVINHARNLQYVRNVVSYVRVKAESGHAPISGPATTSA
ncbi:MAG: BON domain-containing protein [Rhodospirillaceae bacterium]|nr:BON domain-containing protein [Rhodospirillaceae bacterium]